jgi:hypothetical protein
LPHVCNRPIGARAAQQHGTNPQDSPGTRALGKSIGPLFYLVAVGITAAWIVGVFFGLGLFFLTPRSERLVYGWGIESNSSSLSMAETPWLGTTTGAVEPESRPLTGDVRTTPAAVAEPAPMAAPPNQAPSEPTGAPSTPHRHHSGSHRGQRQERTANTRLPQAHAPVQAIQELLQKRAGLLK